MSDSNSSIASHSFRMVTEPSSLSGDTTPEYITEEEMSPEYTEWPRDGVIDAARGLARQHQTYNLGFREGKAAGWRAALHRLNEARREGRTSERRRWLKMKKKDEQKKDAEQKIHEKKKGRRNTV